MLKLLCQKSYIFRQENQDGATGEMLLKLILSTGMDNLTVYFEDTHVVDGRRTLENITTYGDGLAQANNTIFYLFTWPPDEGNSRRLFHEINTVPPHRTSISEIATNGTFCSNSTSAAFVRHKYNNYNIWSTVKATLTTFGSPHFIFFTEEDYHKMNETFMRCPKNNGQGGVSSSSQAPVPLAC
ncbi:uncharacterized protein LOC119183586 isoform X4 [Rhipicephalus microplus]|uniref:uncharacterized protein LOC119183586 isoform X4 n=1 Tax=Rhipicephalus microplus TaxID=6941 RepID=UPI003F6C6702